MSGAALLPRFTGAAVALLLVLNPIGTRAAEHDGAAGPATGHQSVAYQINVAHSGFSADSFAPPLVEKWRRRLKGEISYPLIADGMVFVTTKGSEFFGTWLYALEAGTGATVWKKYIHGGWNWSNAAYEAGRVFVLNEWGQLRAFDGPTGTLVWERRLGLDGFSSAPTVEEGIVYVGGGGGSSRVWAVDSDDGRILWGESIQGFSQSSPALSEDSVFVSYACPLVYAFDRRTGALQWTYDTGCHGGGGKTPSYHEGRLYVRDETAFPQGFVFDAGTGDPLQRYVVDPAPAFSGDLGFFLTEFQYILEARNVLTDQVVWEYLGDGLLNTAPVVVNGVVYMGTETGTLLGLDMATGDLIWSTDVGAPIPRPDEFSGAVPLTGLGAGEGLLVVPAGSVLVAYGE
jgi:outer membrane protein assembly factor BamB